MSHVVRSGLRDALKIRYALSVTWESQRVKNVWKYTLALNTIYFLILMFIDYTDRNLWFIVPITYFVYQWVDDSLTFELAELVSNSKYKKIPNVSLVNKMYGTALLFVFQLMFWGVCQLVHNRLLTLTVSVFGTAWINSFRLFQTRLNRKGWSIETQMEYFESRWLYFLVYGLPLALCDLVVHNFLILTLIKSYVLKLQALNTIHIMPLKYDRVEKLPLFGPVRALNAWVIETFIAPEKTKKK